MKKFKVSYYWRTAGDDIDWETHEVEASNEEEAEEKIMKKLGRVKGFYKVKVEPINHPFGRMQELAGVEEGKSDVFYSNKNKIKDILTNTELIDLINYFSEYYKRDDLGKNFKITGTKLNNILNSIDNYQPYR